MMHPARRLKEYPRNIAIRSMKNETSFTSIELHKNDEKYISPHDLNYLYDGSSSPGKNFKEEESDS
jgi:hypothetical protein